MLIRRCLLLNSQQRSVIAVCWLVLVPAPDSWAGVKVWSEVAPLYQQSRLRFRFQILTPTPGNWWGLWQIQFLTVASSQHWPYMCICIYIYIFFFFMTSWWTALTESHSPRSLPWGFLSRTSLLPKRYIWAVGSWAVSNWDRIACFLADKL